MTIHPPFTPCTSPATPRPQPTLTFLSCSFSFQVMMVVIPSASVVSDGAGSSSGTCQPTLRGDRGPLKGLQEQSPRAKSGNSSSRVPHAPTSSSAAQSAAFGGWVEAIVGVRVNVWTDKRAISKYAARPCASWPHRQGQVRARVWRRVAGVAAIASEKYQKGQCGRWHFELVHSWRTRQSGLLQCG